MPRSPLLGVSALVFVLLTCSTVPVLADHPMQRTHDGTELWIANRLAPSLSVVDLATETLVLEMTLPGKPNALAVTPDDELVLVTSSDLNQVLWVDRRSRGVLQQLLLPGGPSDIVLTPSGRTAFVSLPERRAVARLDVSSFSIDAIYENEQGRFQNRPRSLLMTDDGDREDDDEDVWVLEFTSSGSQIALNENFAYHRLPRLTRISVATGAIEQTVLDLDEDPHHGGLPTNLFGLFLRPNGRELWVVGEHANTARGTRLGGHPEDDRVFLRSDGRFNGPGQLVGSPPYASMIRRFRLSGVERHGKRVHLSDDGPGSRRTPTGGARWVSFTPNGKFAYVLNGTSMNLTVLRARNGRELTTIDVGMHPVAMTFAGRNKAYVLLEHEFSLAILDVRRPARPVRAGTISYVTTPPLSPAVLHGLRLFAAGRNDSVFPASRQISGAPQMACASCHPEGRTNGLTWDQTELGKGPRSTHDLLEWDQSARLGWDAARDEMHDFVNGAARAENGAGEGVFDASLPDRTNDPNFGVASNAGVHPELDQVSLALAELFTRERAERRSWKREPDGALSAAAQRGYDVFVREGCAQCHIPARGFTDSGILYDGINLEVPLDPGSNPDTFKWDVGTIDRLDAPSPAARLNENTGFLSGFDTPHLRFLYDRLTFFHDGRALDLDEVIGTLGSELLSEHAAGGFLGDSRVPGRARDLKEFLLSIDNAPFFLAEGEEVAELGQPYVFRLGGQGGAVPLLLMAFEPGEVRVSGVGTLLLDAATLTCLVDGFASGVALTNEGFVRIQVPVPNDPGLQGMSFRMQAALFDPATREPLGLSNTIDAVVGA